MICLISQCLRQLLKRSVKDGNILLFISFVTMVSYFTRSSCFQEELSAKLLEFLESPHATTEVSLADKEQVCALTHEHFLL